MLISCFGTHLPDPVWRRTRLVNSQLPNPKIEGLCGSDSDYTKGLKSRSRVARLIAECTPSGAVRLKLAENGEETQTVSQIVVGRGRSTYCLPRGRGQGVPHPEALQVRPSHRPAVAILISGRRTDFSQETCKPVHMSLFTSHYAFSGALEQSMFSRSPWW